MTDTKDWIAECVAKIHGMTRLEKNWDSYGGLPVSQATAELASRIAPHIMSDGEIPRSWHAGPMGDGGVQIEAIRPDGALVEVTILHEPNGYGN